MYTPTFKKYQLARDLKKFENHCPKTTSQVRATYLKRCGSVSRIRWCLHWLSTSTTVHNLRPSIMKFAAVHI